MKTEEKRSDEGKYEEKSCDTGGTRDFAFSVGLLSECRDNQNIMDDSCGFGDFNGDLMPFDDE